MTEEERLEALSRAIAAEEASSLQPAAVVRAFLDAAAPEVFGVRVPHVTLRGWLRLEAVRSPFVTGEHCDDAVERVQALCTAFEILTGAPLFPESMMGTVDPGEVIAAEIAIASRIQAAFDTFLPLRLPRRPGDMETSGGRDCGTGWWVRILARLVFGAKMSVDAAMDTPLVVAFALLAGHGANDGQEPAGMTWAEREAVQKIGDRRPETGEGLAAAPLFVGTAGVGEVVGGRVSVAPENPCPQSEQHESSEDGGKEGEHGGRSAVAVEDGEDVERDRGQDERAQNHDQCRDEQAAPVTAGPHLVKTGQDEIDGGAHRGRMA